MYIMVSNLLTIIYIKRALVNCLSKHIPGEPKENRLVASVPKHEGEEKRKERLREKTSRKRTQAYPPLLRCFSFQ